MLQKTLEYLCQQFPEDKHYRVNFSIPNIKLTCYAVVVYTKLHWLNAAKEKLSTHLCK